MAANLKPLEPLAAEPLQQEFLLVANRYGHSLTGTELSLERALAVARGLALGGWRVTVESCDPFLEDGVRYEVWCEDSPE